MAEKGGTVVVIDNQLEARFIDFQKKLFARFSEKNFPMVHTLIRQAEVEFPERLEKIQFWKACVFSLEGKPEQAIEALQNGLEQGIWWNPLVLKNDPDLKTLQEREDFKNILRQCEEIFQKQTALSKPELYVYGNDLADIGIYSLHWRGSNVPDFAPYWLNEVVLEKFYFGFPQSSQVWGYNSYCWDHQETATKEVINMYEKFKQGAKGNKVILAGASQGGKLALKLALEGTIAVEGCIAVIPAINNVDEFKEILQQNPNRFLKCSIVTGDEDYFYGKQLELVELFNQYGLSVKLFVKKGLGHFFPDDFIELLQEAVEFIVNS